MPCVASESIRSVMTRAKRRGIEVHRQGKAHLVGFGAVRDGRQQEHLRPLLAGQSTGAVGDGLHLEGVGAVGEMKVVGLGRSEGQHRHLVGGVDLT